MRKDMARVLVGRPRTGWRIRLRKRKANRLDLRRPDETPRRQSMSRSRGTKLLNENLSPLERYLRSQLGRPWDDVYSEISRCLRPTSAVQQHVRDHLEDFVMVHTSIEDGVGVGRSRCGRPVRLDEPSYRASFYVCPRTGRLRERPRARRKQRPKPMGDEGDAR